MKRRSKPDCGGSPPAREALRETAIGLLARREHSRLELQRKLVQRGGSPDAVAALLTELQDERLLSDERFAEQYVRSRWQRGCGPLRIRAELLARGVVEALANQALTAAGCDDARAAIAVYRKKYGDQSPRDFAERARRTRFLEYRGFTPEQIRAVFRELEG